MKVVILLFLSTILIANVAFSSPLSLFGKCLVHIPNTKCDNINHWKAVVEKVKKEHPTSDLLELAEFISYDLMKDPSKPIYAGAGFEVDKYGNDTNVTAYFEFDESLHDAKAFLKYDMNMCEMGNNLSLMIVFKKKQDALLSRQSKQSFSKKLTNMNPFMTKLSKTVMDSNDLVECSELPKIEGIIDRFDKMNITSPVEYTRLFHKEMKASIKSVMNYIVYYSSLKNELSTILSYDRIKEDDLKSCFPGASIPRCHTCIKRRGLFFVTVSYFEK